MLRRLASQKKPLSGQQVLKKFFDFLNSPVWALPVASFVEQRSIVFDREHGDPTHFHDIHKEFVSTIDTLIAAFCDDLDMKPEDLITALKDKDTSKKLTVKQRTLLEPVVAAQDFNVFVPMMMRKNVELQLQAINMLEVMCGLLPVVFLLDNGNGPGKALEEDSEKYILHQVLRASKAEYEKDLRLRQETQQQFEQALIESESEKKRLETARQLEDKALNEAMTMSNLSIGDEIERGTEQLVENKETDKSRVNPHRPSPVQLNPHLPSPVQLNPHRPSPVVLEEPKKMDEAVIRERAAYLRQQRDKLLELKKAEREKQFKAGEKSAQMERPKTAKAARRTMRGERGSTLTEPVNEQVMAARRALVDRLKAEVLMQ